MEPIPILKGTIVDKNARFRTSLPINLEPSIVDTGFSEGQLISPPGIALVGSGPGADRGAFSWKGVCYRVMGTKLVSVVGAVITTLGEVGSGGPVAFDNSFDVLAIQSGGGLYYWDGVAVTQVTDPDLGVVHDMLWVDGYFMSCDDNALIVTELNDRYAIDPLKYGSSEVDPDPIMCLRKVRGEVYAINRYTIENFQNRGGTGFPFTRNPGGMIPKGAVGRRARADFLDSFAFVGGGRGEAISVYLAGPGQAAPLGTPEVDAFLADLTDDEQAEIELDVRTEEGEQRLYVHLPDKTLVYSQKASRKNEAAVWHVIAGGVLGDQGYPARHICLAAGQWLCGASDGRVGRLNKSIQTQFGAVAGWQFDTVNLFNKGNGFILPAVELFGAPGTTPFGTSSTLFLSFSADGRTWGQEQAISMGVTGQRNKRMQWRPRKRFEVYAAMRFRGANTAIASFASLGVDVEGLN